MRPRSENYTIALDINRERIESVLRETYTACSDMLSVLFTHSQDEFIARVMPYLSSNRISTKILLPLPSREYPEMQIELDPRRGKVFARMANSKKQAHLNHYLKSL